MNRPQRLWHYTNGDALDAIITSGVIDVAYPVASAERGHQWGWPIAWLTSNAVWETAAERVAYFDGVTPVRLNRDDTARLCNGVYRIEVDPTAAECHWLTMLRSVGETSIRGHYEDYWCSFSPIPATLWLGIDRWDIDAAQWRPHMTRDDIAARTRHNDGAPSPADR